MTECPCLGRRHCRRDRVEERKGREIRGPDLLQLGYERSLHGRGRCFSGVQVGPVRRQVGELVVEHDHHALSLAGRAGFDLARAQLRKAGPRPPAVEPAAQPAPVIAVTPSAAAPSSRATLRGVKDILLAPSGPHWLPGSRRPPGRVNNTANLPQPQLVRQMG